MSAVKDTPAERLTPGQARSEVARRSLAVADMLSALDDAAESLSRLHNRRGAYRVTVLQEVRAALAKHRPG